jgi:hypothetical protein
MQLFSEGTSSPGIKRDKHLKQSTMGTALWKKIWRLIQNLNINLPYDPAIPLLGIY